MSIPDARDTPNQRTRQIRRRKSDSTPGAPDELDPTMVGSNPSYPKDPTVRGDKQQALPVEQPFFHEAYDVEEELGRGGMGVVLLATQTSLNRRVAIKLLPMGLDAEAEQARFQQEANVVAQLQHPHIVQIFDYGERDGRPYLVMEYCSGGSLAARLETESLTPKQAARMIETLARAVQHAHERQIIHRDLKPSNILLCADVAVPLSKCFPKIADFGLAKFLDHQDGALTSAGRILGTPSYMSPEQATGEADAIGPRSDVYSLGAILYELLTGKAPFPSANSVSTLRRIAVKPPTPPSEIADNIPDDLEAICLKCLRKSPNKRYTSAEELADDLVRFCDGEDLVAVEVSDAAPRWWTWPVAVWSLAIVLVVILAGVILWDNFGPNTNSGPQPNLNAQPKGRPAVKPNGAEIAKNGPDNTVLLYAGVAEDLQLNADQKTLWQSTSQKIDDLLPVVGFQEPPPLEFTENDAKIDALLAEFVKCLQPHQLKRLGELRIQSEGPLALIENPTVIATLNITKEQRKRLRRHADKFGEKVIPPPPDEGRLGTPVFLPPPKIMDAFMHELSKRQRDQFHQLMGRMLLVGS